MITWRKRPVLDGLDPTIQTPDRPDPVSVVATVAFAAHVTWADRARLAQALHRAFPDSRVVRDPDLDVLIVTGVGPATTGASPDDGL